MAEESLVLEEQPDPRDVAALSDRLYEYNAAATGHDDGAELAMFVRGEDGEIRGGLYGWTWAGRLHIQYFWLHESLRGQGLGSRLLARAEATGRQRGCLLATLDTYSYQSPDFYRRHGYEVYGILDGYPDGHPSILLRKSLSEGTAETSGAP